MENGPCMNYIWQWWCVSDGVIQLATLNYQGLSSLADNVALLSVTFCFEHCDSMIGTRLCYVNFDQDITRWNYQDLRTYQSYVWKPLLSSHQKINCSLKHSFSMLFSVRLQDQIDFSEKLWLIFLRLPDLAFFHNFGNYSRIYNGFHLVVWTPLKKY